MLVFGCPTPFDSTKLIYFANTSHKADSPTGVLREGDGSDASRCDCKERRSIQPIYLRVRGAIFIPCFTLSKFSVRLPKILTSLSNDDIYNAAMLNEEGSTDDFVPRVLRLWV